MIRRTLSTVAAVALAAGLTACSDDKKDPEPKATDATTSAEPTPTEPAWEDAYTEKQLDGYEAALQRWESYLDRSEPIWAAGKATPQAEDLFKEYFPDPSWRGVFSTLKTYEQVEVKVEGQAKVFSSKATKISKDGLNVTIEQCVDYSTIKVTQYGKPAAADKNPGPKLRTVRLYKAKGYPWLILQIQDATSKRKPKPCEP